MILILNREVLANDHRGTIAIAANIGFGILCNWIECCDGICRGQFTSLNACPYDIQLIELVDQ
jgi:hypothetical protein